MNDKTERWQDRMEAKAERKAKKDHLAHSPPRKVLRMIDGKLQEPKG